MNMSFFRDVECGMDVSRMVELGKFDKEFTVYGFAYHQDSESKFTISEHAETMYRLREKFLLQGLSPSLIMSHHVATRVPAGAIDDIWMDIKYELGEKLMKAYPSGFLALLDAINQRPAQNGAWNLLRAFQQELDGRFLKDWQQLFDSVVTECYLAKKLDAAYYTPFSEWSRSIWRQMEDDPVQEDIHARTLHGFAYLKQGKMQYKINAQYIHVCKKRDQLKNEGYIVTPIYSETYWYQTQSQFPDKRKAYEEKLASMMESCMAFMIELQNMPSFIEVEEYLTYYERVQAYDSIPANETFTSYGYQWGCLQH